MPDAPIVLSRYNIEPTVLYRGFMFKISMSSYQFVVIIFGHYR